MTLLTTTYDSKTHKLVPIEPTEEMLERGYEALMDWDARTGEDMSIWQIYRGMLTAAPAAPSVIVSHTNETEVAKNIAATKQLHRMKIAEPTPSKSDMGNPIPVAPTTKESNMTDQANLLIKISNLETAIELLPEDADRDNLLIKAGNLRAAIESAPIVKE